MPEKEKRLCKEAFLCLVIEGLAAGETHLTILPLGGAALGADFLIALDFGAYLGHILLSHLPFGYAANAGRLIVGMRSAARTTPAVSRSRSAGGGLVAGGGPTGDGLCCGGGRGGIGCSGVVALGGFSYEYQHIKSDSGVPLAKQSAQAAIFSGYGDLIDTIQPPAIGGFPVDNICVLLDCIRIGSVLGDGQAYRTCNCFVLGNNVFSSLNANILLRIVFSAIRTMAAA